VGPRGRRADSAAGRAGENGEAEAPGYRGRRQGAGATV